MEDCSSRCVECPFIQHLDNKIASRDALRQESLGGVMEIMGLPPEAKFATRAGQPLSSNPSLDETYNRYIKAAEHHLNLLDKHDVNNERTKDSVSSHCIAGPLIGRKYWLFGKKIMRCTSLNAIIAPNSWTHGPMTED